MVYTLPLFLIAAVLAIAVGSAQVLAHLNVGDTGREGVADVHVADVLEATTITGAVGTQTCNMPSDDAVFDVSQDANKVKLFIHWRFDNKGPGPQRFTVGYKVEKYDGDGGWDQLSKSERKIDKTVAVNFSVKGDCITPELTLDGPTKLKVTVIYDIYRQKKQSKERIFTVDPSIPT